MGDDACWLHRTCLSCGRFLESDSDDDITCPHCGAERTWVTEPPATPDPRGGPPPT